MCGGSASAKQFGGFCLKTSESCFDFRSGGVGLPFWVSDIQFGIVVRVRRRADCTSSTDVTAESLKVDGVFIHGSAERDAETKTKTKNLKESGGYSRRIPTQIVYF
jgi:hypothetical protein